MTCSNYISCFWNARYLANVSRLESMKTFSSLVAVVGLLDYMPNFSMSRKILVLRLILSSLLFLLVDLKFWEESWVWEGYICGRICLMRWWKLILLQFINVVWMSFWAMSCRRCCKLKWISLIYFLLSTVTLSH